MILDLPIAHYHASSHVSSSKLRTYAEYGAYAYKQKHVLRVTADEPAPEHFTFGSILEDIVQQRPFDESRYAVKPDAMTFATKEGKAWRAERQAEGREIITQADMRVMTEMTLALSENATALSMIGQCVQQPSFMREYDGLPGVQARPDWYSESCRFSLDLKTTKDITDITSGRSIRALGYHSQAALVQYCAKSPEPQESWLLAVEKQFPYRCQLVRISDSWLQAGWEYCERHLEALAKNYAEDNWPRTEKDVAELRPYWLDGDHAKAR